MWSFTKLCLLLLPGVTGNMPQSHKTRLHLVFHLVSRLYPVVPGNGRLTVDNEVVVDTYWFPKEAGSWSWSSSTFPLQLPFFISLDVLFLPFLPWFPWQTQFHLCHYAASHDEGEFPNPERFLPERWLRQGTLRLPHHPYSSIPFGVGVRACVGKRVAELEMYFALSRVRGRRSLSAQSMSTFLAKVFMNGKWLHSCGWDLLPSHKPSP